MLQFVSEGHWQMQQHVPIENRLRYQSENTGKELMARRIKKERSLIQAWPSHRRTRAQATSRCSGTMERSSVVHEQPTNYCTDGALYTSALGRTQGAREDRRAQRWASQGGIPHSVCGISPQWLGTANREQRQTTEGLRSVNMSGDARHGVGKPRGRSWG